MTSDTHSRFTLPPDLRRQRRSITMSTDEWDEVKAVAKGLGMTTASFIRAAALEKARETHG